MKPILLGLLLLACATVAGAHKASDAYITLERNGQVLRGQWDIALRDLDAVMPLDSNGDGEITWGELRGHAADVAAYALPRLSVESGGAPCTLVVQRQLVDVHTDGAYAVLELAGRCAEHAPTLRLDYRLFHEVDRQHRGLLNLVEHGESRSTVFTADAPTQIVGGDTGGALAQLATYVHEGVWHIWRGYDHILFLLSLLLPAVLVRRDGTWQAATSFRAALVDVTKVVTAFTVAHSITLTLAALGVVALPSRLVESAIALSVVLAALNNVFPLVAHARWLAAFGFGLLHGFGFAGALQDLGLPTGSLALSLAGFNVGVELGQLAIVAAFLPAAFALRGTRTYRRGMLTAGSMAIAAIAAVWLVERAFDLPLFAALAAG